jgi:hypothetical protein
VRGPVSLLVLFVLIPALSVAAQGSKNELVAGSNNVLVGFATLPGIGVQATYVAPGRMYTREALLISDLSRLGSKRSSQVAVAIGGAIRIIGSLEVLGMARPRRYDIHAGVRIGPGLLFRFAEDKADRNRRFSLTFEPFVRYTISLKRLFYIEAGVTRPNIRLGFKL